jgi:hypothetical protein
MRSRSQSDWRSMKVSDECLQHAKECEEQAEACAHASNRDILLSTAAYWRRFGRNGSHLADFVIAYNFARRLKTLLGLTPYEYVCKTWSKEPERFTLDPTHQMPGLIT